MQKTEQKTLDIPMLKEQQQFLLTYAWREGHIPELMEGLIVLIDYILDEAATTDCEDE